MSTQDEQDKSLDAKIEGCGLSRREFLRNAGFVIGGASLGSLAFLAACSGGKTVTVGGAGSTVTKTVTAGAGSTVTVTQTANATATATTTAVAILTATTTTAMLLASRWAL